MTAPPALPAGPWDGDKPREACGIFGMFGHPDAAAHTALGLHALQHRGQEAAGIVSFDGAAFHAHRGLGRVGDEFGDPETMRQLPGDRALGHVRYATQGELALRNVQPVFADLESGGVAMAHNGNLTDARRIRRELVRRGCIFQSTMDTEVIVHLVATSAGGAFVDRLIDALRRVTGAWSLAALTGDALIGARDPFGVRPLQIGRLDGGTILTSESCALDIIGAEFVRDVRPGEVVIIDREGMRGMSPFPPAPRRFCVFEYIYFSRPDSTVDGRNVYAARKRLGAELARERSVCADVVAPVPDSGVPAALGYAEQAGLPFELGIVRNHYVGRTFIEPTDSIRHLGVKLKHNANRETLAGKRVALVDDSIVRGATSLKIVEMVREAGAAEVHMRIASPPTAWSCFYGVDTPDRSELLAAQFDTEAIARRIGVDSLAFLSIDGLYRAMGAVEGRAGGARRFCDACFTGDYPIALSDREDGASPQLSLLAVGA